MRLADAAHVDLGSFYARRPGLGRVYRLAGYAACIGVLWWSDDPRRIGGLMIVLLIAWAMAWKREVGTLFRSPLVAAIAMCAVVLTADRLGHPLRCRPACQDDGGRSIEFRVHGPPSPGFSEGVK